MIANHDELKEQYWKAPDMDVNRALRIQQKGFETFGTDFWFIFYDLLNFSFSPSGSRTWDNDGNLLFTGTPFIDSDLVVYSGTIDPEFAAYRLGCNLTAPFADCTFIHPDTRWYNIASRIGMKKYFMRHSPQILDFFSVLIALRIKEGKRVLLVSKKAFRTKCAREIERGVRESGLNDVQVVTNHWERVDLTDHNFIPLINYGIVGINLFQDFDVVYCLNGYYVNEQIINSVLQDIVAPECVVPLQMETKGLPLRRWADLREPCQDMEILQRLVPKALHQLEMEVVLQAVGRVRPYTSPREVITFQCAAHPQLNYTKEFENLEDARTYFGISKKRDRQKDSNEANVKEARMRGLTQVETAEELGLGLRTVKRRWN
jgi:hypothetical protein